MSQISDAEIAGDTDAVRSLVSILQNRALLPAKVLIFQEDARPGYFGTWTRPKSKLIGPRRPLGRDVIALDYNYDSAGEWEDEEDADDVGGEDLDEEDGLGDEADSDVDSWLVDDDRVEESGSRSPTPDLMLLPLPAKRKPTTEEGGQSKAKKRKVVVPLLPVVKGPCWESSIGHCSYEPFNTYRIHLFNGESSFLLLQIYQY